MAYVVRMDPASAAPEPETPRPARAQVRTGPTVVAAVLTELVVIGVACNQWVIPHVIRSIIDERREFLHDVKATLLTYNWRLAPEHGDRQHTWLSQELLVLTTVVLSAVLIAVVVRGPATFGRVFVTCWLAVTVATMFGTYVRGLVNDEVGVPGSRITHALFGPLGPSPITFLAGVLLGLVVALVATTVAVLTRRPATAPAGVQSADVPYVAPEQPPAHYGEDAPTELHRPVVGEQRTARFPRPPDDGGLGRVQY